MAQCVCCTFLVLKYFLFFHDLHSTETWHIGPTESMTVSNEARVS